jgi:hypothetical protein
MKVINTRIGIYNWDLTLFIVDSPSDAREAKKLFIKHGISKKTIREIIADIKDNATNGGIHMSDFAQRHSLAGIMNCTSFCEKIIHLAHEARHIEDTILMHCGIEDREAAAYLSGFLTRKFLKLLK